jgi:hypothetical protein
MDFRYVRVDRLFRTKKILGEGTYPSGRHIVLGQESSLLGADQPALTTPSLAGVWCPFSRRRLGC